MKNWLSKIVVIMCLFICFAFFLVSFSYKMPLVYTVVFGDANTRILYDAYRFAKKNNPDRKMLESYLLNKEVEYSNNEYLINKKIEYSYDEELNQYVIFSYTRPDAVYITYDNDNRLSEVLFSPD